MKFPRNFLSIFFALLLCLSLFGTAIADSYAEGTDGDISDDGLNPTVLNLTSGNNTVTATTNSGDVEYLAITIPANHKIDALMVDAYTFDDAPEEVGAASVPLDGAAFIAVQSGTTFTEPTVGTEIANLLGYALFGSNFDHVGTDILDEIGAGNGAIGFTAPLVGSNYTFWMQQTGDALTTYTLNFMVSELTPTALEAVDEPADLISPSYQVDGTNILLPLVFDGNSVAGTTEIYVGGQRVLDVTDPNVELISSEQNFGPRNIYGPTIKRKVSQFEN